MHRPARAFSGEEGQRRREDEGGEQKDRGATTHGT
jgi:hypothetical protein